MVQTLRMAWNAVIANKLRTFLTMLGIMIGVTALIVLVSIGNGASDSVSSQISSMGSDYMSVRISDDKENPIRITEFLTLFDENLDTIEAAAPIARSSAAGESSYEDGTVSLYGTTGGYFDIMGMEVQFGRSLKMTDITNHTYVIVLSYDSAVELFGHADAVGETLELDGRKFEVVGVLSQDAATQSSAMTIRDADSDDEEEEVSLEGYIPYSTMSRITSGVLDIDQFYVSAVSAEDMSQAEEALTQLLMKRFNNDSDAFTITTQTEIMEAQENVSSTMSLMLGGIAAISLLVGGIGIMNIMLVSVTERTREIGIRKAVGATRKSILTQFLMEATMVSLAGCLCGIAVSEVILKIAGRFMSGSMTLTMDTRVALIAVLFSAVIGVVFGLYPAQKAARKKPIDALRFS